MPRERIGSQGGLENQPHVEITWHPEPAGHVQVAVLLHRPDSSDPISLEARSIAQQIVKDAREQAEPVQITEGVGTLLDQIRTDDKHRGVRGLYATLDRGGLNRLVKVARRARNSAFGADE